MTDSPTYLDSSDGTRLALWELGGDGPPLLAVHATGFCAQVWGPMASSLTDRFKVFALDVRAHGRSPIEDGTETLVLDWERVGQDVDAAAAFIGEPLHGIGHSMGGAGLVLSAHDFPDRYRALWLFEPIVFPPEFRAPAGAPNPLAEGARRRRARFDSIEAARANFAAKPPLNVLSAEALNAYVTYGFRAVDDGIELRCKPEWEAALYDGGPYHRGWDCLDDITTPTAVVVGEAALFGPSQFAPAVADRLPNGRLIEMRDLGHFGPLQAPTRCSESVIEHFVG